MTPEQEGARCQEAGEGVARAIERIEDFLTAATDALLPDEEAELRSYFATVFDAARQPAPSPHGCFVILVCRACGKPSDGPVNEGCECPEDTICDPVTVRETAPTEPRSISEERLERLRELADLRGGVRGAKERFDLNVEQYADALTALLADREHWKAAYEQAEARADRAETIAAHWCWNPDPVGRSCGECDNCERWDRVLAERDTAQASEARLREAAAQADDLLRRLSEWDTMQTQADGSFWLGEIASARVALASTPNPEERACTCPPSAFTGYYTPANSCPRHGSAPDPTPEPEEDHAVRHGARWLPPKENE